jgi:hypothetical protein
MLRRLSIAKSRSAGNLSLPDTQTLEPGARRELLERLLQGLGNETADQWELSRQRTVSEDEHMVEPVMIAGAYRASAMLILPGTGIECSKCVFGDTSVSIPLFDCFPASCTCIAEFESEIGCLFLLLCAAWLFPFVRRELALILFSMLLIVQSNVELADSVSKLSR